MPLVYNKEVFNKFKTLAITNVKNLIIGNTYYSNNDQNSNFKLLELITRKEAYRRAGRFGEEKRTPNDIFAMVILRNDDVRETIFLSSYNIGKSHTPWLIFDNKQISQCCVKELSISFQPI